MINKSETFASLSKINYDSQNLEKTSTTNKYYSAMTVGNPKVTSLIS